MKSGDGGTRELGVACAAQKDQEEQHWLGLSSSEDEQPEVSEATSVSEGIATLRHSLSGPLRLP